MVFPFRSPGHVTPPIWEGGLILKEGEPQKRMKIVESGGLIGLAPMRRRAGLSRQQLADQIGVTRQAVSNYERGIGWPSAGLLPAIAGALVCSIDELYEVPPVEPEDSEAMVTEEDAEDHAV